MAHARNEIAQHQRPLPEPLEPVLEAVQPFLEVPPEKRLAREAPDRVAHRDPHDIPGARGDQRGDQVELALTDERPCHRQQRFIRNRQADDAQGEKAEERRRPIVGDPAQQQLFHYLILILPAG